MVRVAIITASDKGASGEREDKSGPLVAEIVAEQGYKVSSIEIIPDEREQLAERMRELCDSGEIDLILTTGGTGFSPRDWTPEATLDIIHRQAYGIPEAMRAFSMQKTDRAMLSRGIAGIRGKTLIVNLPGSPKAVRENLECVLPALEHGLEILTGSGGDCAVGS